MTDAFNEAMAILDKLEGIRCFTDGSTGFSATWLVPFSISTGATNAKLVIHTNSTWGNR